MFFIHAWVGINTYISLESWLDWIFGMWIEMVDRSIQKSDSRWSNGFWRRLWYYLKNRGWV